LEDAARRIEAVRRALVSEAGRVFVARRPAVDGGLALSLFALAFFALAFALGAGVARVHGRRARARGRQRDDEDGSKPEDKRGARRHHTGEFARPHRIFNARAA
jgi:hypothetical protein